MHKELARKAGDASSVMKSVAADLQDSTEENFGQEDRPKWEPLKETTKKARA